MAELFRVQQQCILYRSGNQLSEGSVLGARAASCRRCEYDYDGDPDGGSGLHLEDNKRLLIRLILASDL